jgi:hypothetical protein
MKNCRVGVKQQSLTYSGIAAARDNSPLLVFTDADAKDANRLQEAIDAAIAKNISVTL